MLTFKYTALNRAGKRVKGSLEAASVETAKSSLRHGGYTILEIYEPGAMERDISLPFLGKPKSRDMAVFCRQFVSMLHAGVPASQALSMLSRQTENKKLAAALRRIQADVEKGDALADAMERHPRIFLPVLVKMVAAGEEAGNTEEAFRQMEGYFDKLSRTRAAVSKAMTYPAVLAVVMLIVIVLMMTKIIPSFMKTFSQMDMELPPLTRGVMAVSDFFGAWWWLAAILAAGLVLGVGALSRSSSGRRLFSWLALRVPIVKNFTVRSSCAVFCRVLTLLTGSGIGLIESLELTADSIGNVYFRDAARDIAEKVAEGSSLNGAIEETGVFPSLVSSLVAVGEESGDIRGMLEKAADYYAEETSDASRKLLALLEPIMLVILAALVAILVAAIFLPMMNMTQAYDAYL